MKTVYRFRIQYTLNDEHITSMTKWHYGELPTEADITSMTFDEALKHYNYCGGKRLFSKKRHIRLHWTETWVNEEDFESASVIATAEPIDREYSVADLAKELAAEDFVEWCKDHGLNEIRIA